MNADQGLRSAPIAQQASAWFLRNAEGQLAPAERAQFAHWLAESPAHIREYLAVAETWGTLQRAAQCWPDRSSAALIDDLRDTAAAKIITLSDAPDRAARTSRVRGPLLRLVALAASVILIPIALVVAWWIDSSGTEYVTHRGEQRSVVLEDGSIVQLNTLTRMIVRFDRDRRRIELPQGEAFFRVARDAARPFYVETPFAVVQAIGTEFNVYARAQSTRVAVVEGKVQVASKVEPDRQTREASAQNSQSTPAITPQLAPIALTARESVAIGSDHGMDALVVREIPDAQVATAWIQRRLVFEDERVDRAVEEFNRYNQLQMRVRDPQLGALRISGVFNADQPQTLVTYLERIHAVTAVQQRDGLVLSSAIRTL